MRRSKQKFLAVGGLLVSLFVSTKPASAFFSGVQGGLELPNLSGTPSQQLRSTRVGWGLDVFLDVPKIAPHTELILSGSFLPFNVQNLTNTDLNFVSGFLGIQVSAPQPVLLLVPTFTAQIGGTYGWLDFLVQNNAIQNQQIYFAAKLSPGVDIPVAGPVSIAIRFPLTFLFTNPTTTLFSQYFALRWSL